MRLCPAPATGWFEPSRVRRAWGEAAGTIEVCIPACWAGTGLWGAPCLERHRWQAPRAWQGWVQLSRVPPHPASVGCRRSACSISLSRVPMKPYYCLSCCPGEGPGAAKSHSGAKQVYSRGMCQGDIAHVGAPMLWWPQLSSSSPSLPLLSQRTECGAFKNIFVPEYILH